MTELDTSSSSTIKLSWNMKFQDKLLENCHFTLLIIKNVLFSVNITYTKATLFNSKLFKLIKIVLNSWFNFIYFVYFQKNTHELLSFFCRRRRRHFFCIFSLKISHAAIDSLRNKLHAPSLRRPYTSFASLSLLV